MKTYSLIFLLLILTSCDELLNPSSDYVIEKTVKVSSNEQVFQSGEDIKIIFPANSVKSDFTLKIKKEGSYPTFSIPNAKLGSNTYRIKFSGNTAFATPVKIIINYDKSQITEGKTAAEIIRAYIYANGNWKLATYQLDEPNSKIIISISNLETPKTSKDTPEFQGDGEIIMGDGYTTVDSGVNDFVLAKYKYLSFIISNGSNWDVDPNNGGGEQWGTFIVSGKERPLIKWYENRFSIKILKEYEGTIENLEVNGEAKEIGTDKKDGYVTIIKLTLYCSKVSSVSFLNKEYSCVVENVRLKLPNNPNLPSCFSIINGNDISKYVTDIKAKIHSEEYYHTFLDQKTNYILAFQIKNYK
jgi:hypothetical protein